MKIGELAQKTGFRTSAIRYYESIGLLPNATRQSGQRVYEQNALERLVMIQTAAEAGLSLDEIRFLLVDAGTGKPFSDAVRKLARKKVTELEDRIRRMKALRNLFMEGSECGCIGPKECSVFLRAAELDSKGCRSCAEENAVHATDHTPR